MEPVSRKILTAEGTKLVMDFEPLYGVDTDGNRINAESQAWVGQSGVARGGNVSRLSDHLSRLGFTVHTQGDDNGDLVCDWFCSVDTCNLRCAPAPE